MFLVTLHGPLAQFVQFGQFVHDVVDQFEVFEEFVDIHLLVVLHCLGLGVDESQGHLAGLVLRSRLLEVFILLQQLSILPIQPIIPFLLLSQIIMEGFQLIIRGQQTGSGLFHCKIENVVETDLVAGEIHKTLQNLFVLQLFIRSDDTLALIHEHQFLLLIRVLETDILHIVVEQPFRVLPILRTVLDQRELQLRRCFLNLLIPLDIELHRH